MVTDRQTDSVKTDREINQRDSFAGIASCKNQTKTVNDICAMYTHYPQKKITFIKQQYVLM